MILRIGGHAAVDLEEVLVHDHLGQNVKGGFLILARLGDGEGIAVELGRDLAVDRWNHRDVPLGLGEVEAAGVPSVGPHHAHIAGAEGVALAEQVAVVVIAGRHKAVFPYALIVPLPCLLPVVGNHGGLHVFRVVGQTTAEEGRDAARVRPLFKETELFDGLGIELGIGRVVARFVYGQLLRQRLERRKVPRLALVLLANFVRRIGQLGFVKQRFVVVEEGGEQRERDADEHALVLGELE